MSTPTTSITQMSIPHRYRSVADGFTRRVAGTEDWDAPSPVKEWRARDVVRHLTTWLPPMLESSAAVHLEPGPSADEDPVLAWTRISDQVQDLLDDPASADRVFDHPYIGVLSLPAAIDQYFTSDVVFHTWDLARATGQDDALDADFIAAAYAGMSASAEMIRGSGQFGEQQPVSDDAPLQERFFAFLGRDPHFAPSPTRR